MKRLLLILGIVLATEALADGPVNLPNLRQNATGTSLGGGKFALDVSLPPGAVTISGGANTGAVFGASDPGLLILGVRHDATGALTGVADGDVSPVQFDSNGNLKVIGSEVATAADGAGALPGLLKIMGGWDGSNVHVALMDSSGRFHVVSRMVDGAGTALTSTLNGGKQSLDVNVSASALPSGAATESTLSTLNGKIAALGQAAMAASHPVVIASDQGAIAVAPNTPVTSSMVLSTVDNSTASVNAAPANCRGFQIFADADNTADLRVRYGATDPTASVGMQLEPGRSIDFVPGCPSIRLISESGTQAFQIAWFTD